MLSLPIEERRAIQKQRLIAEYMIKAGKATIDYIDGAGLQPRNSSDDDDYYVAVDDNGNLSAKVERSEIEDDGDLVEIDGEVYKIG